MRQDTPDSGTDGRRSRRGFLRRSAAALAAGAVGANAGCLSMLPPASQKSRYGSVDVPERSTDGPAYRKWMPADDELPPLEYAEGIGDTNWAYVTPGDLGRDELGWAFGIGQNVVQSRLDYVGFALESYDRAVGLGSLGAVVEASVDRDAVRATLRETRYEPAASYREYELYDRTDVPRVVAVSDDAIVHAAGEHRRTKAETLADAGAGRVRRRHEVDDAFAAYTDWLGSDPTVLRGFGQLEGTTFDALTYTFDEDAAYISLNHRFPAGETPSKSEVKRAIDGIGRNQRASLVDVTVDDRNAVVALRLGEREFADEPNAGRLPFVTWGVDDDGETVTVHHEAGEAVAVDRLEVDPADALRDPPAEGSLLEPGDALSFDADDLRRDTTAANQSGDDAGTVETSHVHLAYELAADQTALLFEYDPVQNDTTT